MQKRELKLLTAEAVPSSYVGERVDKWLSIAFAKMSRTRIASLIKEGFLSVSGEAVNNASYKVQEGEIFILAVPESVEADPVPQDIPLEVMYEDKDIIVINKPAGMVVHPAAGNYQGTLVNALLAHCKDLSGVGGVKRPGIVHRIDKETSGILVVAKNDEAHHALSLQFQEHSIKRVYKALVWGVPSPSEGVIEGNIGRSRTNRKKMALLKSGGKEAFTNYKVLKVLWGGAISLIECRLQTGRTHQIRVHMTAKGHPLIGDKTYGGGQKANKKLLSEEMLNFLKDFPRQALHAESLAFMHPLNNKELAFFAPMPADMQEILNRS